MQVFRNPNRLREMFTEASLSKTADAVLSPAGKKIRQALLFSWFLLLCGVFTFLMVIRIALTIPMPWGK